jgi:type I restriction enzyme, S subunit
MAFSVSAFGFEEDDLPQGWMADRIDTLAFLNPEQISGDYLYSEIAYLDIANVAAGVVGKPVKLSLADAPSRAKRIVRPNDTILSTVRPGNRAYAFLRETPDNLIVSTGFAVLRAKSSAADPRFVYYLATGNPIINYLASIAEEKTAYPSVNPDDIAECVVPVPPLAEQRAIAHILGTLDDKIELNRRMNETLEAMARAIFKSWFVDFDPVRAKAEGRDPGLPKAITDLFPACLVDSELGKIPEGWEVQRLSDLCSTQYGYTASAVDEPVGPKFLRVTDINKRNWIEWGDVPHCAVEPDTRASYVLKVGDLVVARMADPGKSAIIEEETDAIFASYLVRLRINPLGVRSIMFIFPPPSHMTTTEHQPYVLNE